MVDKEKTDKSETGSVWLWIGRDELVEGVMMRARGVKIGIFGLCL